MFIYFFLCTIMVPWQGSRAQGITSDEEKIVKCHHMLCSAKIELFIKIAVCVIDVLNFNLMTNIDLNDC